MWDRESESDAGTIEPSAVPRQVRCDITKLTLGRVDAFLLSQIDGSSSVDDLASLLGLPVAEACAAVARLLSLGLIRVPGLRRTKAPPARRSSTSIARQTVAPPRKTKAPGSRRAHAPIPRETVAPGPASRRGERGAVSVDVFSTPRSRKAERQKAHAKRPTKAPSVPPKSAKPRPSRAPSLRPAPRLSLSPPDPPSQPAEEPKRARIRVPSGRFHPAAAKVRLAKTEIPPRMRSIAAAAPDEGDGLHHARLFVAAAERELSNGNVVAAAAQLKLARSCCDTPEIRKAYEAVEEQAKERRLELQLAVCATAEKDARWGDAAEAYSKAYTTSATPRLAERWANALRLSEGDLRVAAKMAEEAVRAEPQNGSYRVTLGEVYADAGLELRAQAEARRALELLPSDARAQALASRVQKRGR
jgi:hypothetical protein